MKKLGRLVLGLLRATRPSQWPKNGLVVIAPAAAGVLGHGPVLRHTLVAFAAFTVAASGVYLLNDARDKEKDQQHPRKRLRPIASGIVPVPVAVVTGIALLVASLAIPLLALSRPRDLTIILGIYIAETFLYIVGLKQQPVVELALVASGFFLRALAGAAASHLYVSNWFLVVTAFSALFLVVGKRLAELQQLGAEAPVHRPVLGDYSLSFLRSALTLCAGVVVTTYCLWAFDVSATGLSSVHHLTTPMRLTVVPVVVAMLHILRRLDLGEGGAPEDLVFSDRLLQVVGLVWVVLFAVGIYG